MDLSALLDHAYAIKKRFLTMYKQANAGHIGCSLSCTEMLVFVRFGWMKEHDVLVLSKGHAAAALYAVLAEAGSLTEEEIKTFYADGTILSAHPPVNKIPDIPFATGSLGHGLSLTAGMALAARLKNQQRTFFCITSDGELNEGSVWEAALFIRQQQLHNVVWLIDRNGIQGIGRTEEVMALEPLAAKLESFGFFVVAADGHNFASLAAGKDKALDPNNIHHAPIAMICKTVKGNGLGPLENSVECHYLPLTDRQYEQTLDNLTVQYRISKERNRNEG
jgi:transketolase